MKTTLNIRDDLVRRAKARAALRGQGLARYIEEGLEQRLEAEESRTTPLSDWLKSLPRVSRAALAQLEKTIGAEDFRKIDEAMWE